MSATLSEVQRWCPIRQKQTNDLETVQSQYAHEYTNRRVFVLRTEDLEQLVKLEEDIVNPELDKNIAKENRIIHEGIYYVDDEGYLLDAENKYLLT